MLPLPLTDGRFLKFTMSLFIEQTDQGPRIKVKESSFQYQVDASPDTEAWIFRYDYTREPHGSHPQAHLQINGDLRTENVLPANRPLGRIHFPTRRMPIEGVIRLLIEEFAVPAVDQHWRAILTAAENEFWLIVHEPPLGPPA